MANDAPVKVIQRGRRDNLLYRDSTGALRTRRARTHEEKEAASQFALLRSLIADPAFWSVAMMLPGNRRRTGAPGRPTHHPAWTYLLIAGLTTITGSQRSAITFISDPVMWDFLRHYTAQHMPQGLDPVGDSAPERHHLSTFLRKWESAEWAPIREASHRQFRTDATTRARETGMFNPEQELRYATVDHGQHVVYDGTVFNSPSNTRRAAADAENWQLKAGRERVWGSKVTFATTRGDDYQTRLVLDYEQVTGTTATGVGDEAASTITSALRLKETLPGIRGVIIDSALRGKHLKLLADHGLIVTNYPHALRNPHKRSGGRFSSGREEKKKQLRTLTHKRPNGTQCQHRLDIIGSIFHTDQYDADGMLVPTECPVIGYESRRNPSGSHRYYLTVQVPCVHGTFTTKVPLYHEDRNEFAIKGLNRGELLRFYPTNSPQFQALYGRRNDSESFHQQIKRRLTRLPAYRSERQALFILGMALLNNAYTRAVALRRDNKPNPLDGTQ